MSLGYLDPHEKQPRLSSSLSPEALDGLLNGIDSGEIISARTAVNDCLDYDWINAALAAGTPYESQLSPVFAGLELHSDILSQLAEQMWIRDVDLDSIDQRTHQIVSNAASEKIACAVVAQFGGGLPRSNQIAQTVAEVADTAFGKARTRGSNYIEAFGLTKEILAFGSDLISAKALKETLGEYVVRPRERREIELLSSENDTLFEITRFLQRYQMKSALVKGAGAGRLRDWMVHEPGYMLALASEVSDLDSSKLFPKSGTLGRFYGTNYEFVSSVPVFEQHGILGNGVLRINFDGVIRGHGGGNPAPNVVTELDSDGQLKGVRGISFQEFASQLGMSEQYELLRGEILAIYCDLVIPAHLVNEASGIEQQAVRQRHGKESDTDKIRRLVIARTRLIQTDPQRIEQEIKKESRKSPDQHPVIGFIRSLPRGFRANHEARENCRKYLGKELAAEGETFVIPHTRGGNGSIDDSEPKQYPGHRAVRRQVGGSVVSGSVGIKFN